VLSLQAPPSKPALGSLSERSNNVAEMPVEEGPENPLVCQHMKSEYKLAACFFSL
jgi:hypothetical protein